MQADRKVLPKPVPPLNSRLPLSVRFADTEYIDGITIDHVAFYEKLMESKELPTTSQISPQTFADVFESEITYESELQNRGIRFIFCDSVNGESMLPAFSPEKVHIKGADYDFITDDVTVAMTEKKLMQGEYEAILPMGLFDNGNFRKDESESEKNAVTVEELKSKAL